VRSRGTVTNARAGDGGLRGAGGHTAGGLSLLSSDVGVDGSSAFASASFALSPADDNAGAGGGGDEAEADGGEEGKGVVLMGGSAGKASSAGDAIASLLNYRRRRAHAAVNRSQILPVLGWGGGAIVRIGESGRE
jgi:hypothetical protein